MSAQLGSVAGEGLRTVGVCQLMRTSPTPLPGSPTSRFGSTQTSLPSMALQPQATSSESQSPSLSVSAPAPGVQMPPWQVSPMVQFAPSEQRTPSAFGVGTQVPPGSVQVLEASHCPGTQTMAVPA